jgi:hypothetical protein
MSHTNDSRVLRVMIVVIVIINRQNKNDSVQYDAMQFK